MSASTADKPEAAAAKPTPPAGKRRRRAVVRRRTPAGSAPGTLIADATAPPPVIHVMAYGSDTIEEFEAKNARAVAEHLGSHPVLWVDVQGLGDLDTLAHLGEVFDLHRLALEDVVNVHQRAKVEEYPGNLFIVTRMPARSDRVETEQMSMFLGKNYVLTFQERYGDHFDAVRQRLRTSVGGRIRSSGPDYLAYALLDASVDAYFPVLERFGELVEDLELEVTGQPEAISISHIHDLKRDLLDLRRAIWPLREMINVLIRGEDGLVGHETKLYLRDVYDHAVQLLDIVETYREVASGMVDVYLSSVSAKMNEVMQVLTVIATIFIPLSFVASLYGMNFDPDISPWNMPELRWRFGYPYALGLMTAMTAIMLYYFRRRGWLGGRKRKAAPETRDGRPGDERR